MFSKEQIERLSPWEENFETAVKAKWAMNPGSTAAETIVSIWNEATGENRRLHPGCGNCIFMMLEDVGKMYFESKLELKAKEVAAGKAKVVESTDKPVKELVVKHVAIRTKAKK